MRGIVPNKKHKGLRVKQFVFLILILAIAQQVQTAYATPVAPVLLVNPTLKQCIDHVILADECHACRPVEGWEISQTGQCPSEYKIIPRQTIMDQDLPVSCVEYPKNEWPYCSLGVHPTITPEFATLTVQQPAIDLPTTSVASPTPAITRYSFDYLFILCMGCILGITIIGVIFMLLRRKKILTVTKPK
jgi:hypothetical protein